MDVELIKKDPSKSLSAMFYINFVIAVIVILADLVVIVLERKDKLRITASLVLLYLKLVVVIRKVAFIFRRSSSCIAFNRCVNFSNVSLDIIIFILLAPYLKDKFVILLESGLVLSFVSSCFVACQFWVKKDEVNWCRAACKQIYYTLLFFLMLPLDYEIFKDGRPYI
jgi:hypothetical protein